MPDITIHGADGDFSAYLAMPSGGTGPGIIAIQEIFGVNADMREHCDRFAAMGYIAISPDLFWRQEPGIQITDQTEAEWQQAFKLYQGCWPILWPAGPTRNAISAIMVSASTKGWTRP